MPPFFVCGSLSNVRPIDSAPPVAQEPVVDAPAPKQGLFGRLKVLFLLGKSPKQSAPNAGLPHLPIADEVPAKTVKLNIKHPHEYGPKKSSFNEEEFKQPSNEATRRRSSVNTEKIDDMLSLHGGHDFSDELSGQKPKGRYIDDPYQFRSGSQGEKVPEKEEIGRLFSFDYNSDEEYSGLDKSKIKGDAAPGLGVRNATPSGGRESVNRLTGSGLVSKYRNIFEKTGG
ncbi:hypothetical protein SIAM614_00827 [Stappia aggregata IAM 12614]|uniref:Uncharacterized protein n=1 Tax=Roseibium aggregatum (strain ATCC 25650 / DSM 13394 / JCM 20685 / NBRC 16684 / NCIMB 2208 / IAM 12614 / B1) TaxID=384765 RepID=A0P2T8_ROSAI|nr:hypothetical protein [Roseibium aggregatum]EAV40741.1 hypothetical protein SIAM614_00827 [Stappia aggregata IAM 12614] [Roseibium aggregatum IAM 12614]